MSGLRWGEFKYTSPDSAEDYNLPQWEQLRQDRAWEELDLIKRIQDGDESAKVELDAHKKEDDILKVMALEVNYFWD